MTKETFDKKLAFTIESVEKNKGYVSGIISFSDGGYVVFDEDYIKRISRLVLYNFSSKRVKRVYPDCC